MKNIFTKPLTLIVCLTLSFAVSGVVTAAEPAAQPRTEQATPPVPTVTAAQPTQTTPAATKSATPPTTAADAADPANKTAKPATGKQDDFVPTAQISEDLSVSFPADI
jgi:hypothetical protein